MHAYLTASGQHKVSNWSTRSPKPQARPSISPPVILKIPWDSRLRADRLTPPARDSNDFLIICDTVAAIQSLPGRALPGAATGKGSGVSERLVDVLGLKVRIAGQNF